MKFHKEFLPQTAPKPRANHIENIMAEKQAKAGGKKLRYFSKDPPTIL